MDMGISFLLLYQKICSINSNKSIEKVIWYIASIGSVENKVYSIKMNKFRNFSIACLSFGAVMVFIAVFASALGLDQNPGWSRPRFVLLMAGLIFIGIALLCYRYAAVIHPITERVRLFLEDLPVMVLTIPLVVFVLFFNAWFANAGNQTGKINTTDYYHQQASGFLKGELHLPINVAPELLALSNPYDPYERRLINVPVDVSLYNGRYYLYWGPVPALMVSAASLLGAARIVDLWLALFFVCGIFVIQIFLLLFVWRRYYNDLPKWTFHLSIPLIGLGIPLVLLRHNYDPAKIYEAAITGAQFFFLCGLLAFFTVIVRSSNPNWRFVVVGVFWALAIGTRQIYAIPIGILLLLLVFQIYRICGISTEAIKKLISLAVPMLLGLVGLGWYNWARFGSVTEFGMTYQLAAIDLTANYDSLFSTSYILQNLYNYLLMGWNLDSEFPFVFMVKGNEEPILSNYFLPDLYNAQPIVGLLYLFPFSVFTLVLIFTMMSKDGTADATKKRMADSSKQIILSAGISFLIPFSVLMAYFWSAMRFVGDFLPAFMMLSVIGFWHGFHSLRHTHTGKQIYSLLGLILAALSVLLGTLLAISTNSKLINILIKNIPFLG
jgi:hypothetical protein